MAKIQNKPHLTNFIKQNYIWILMIVTMSCIHLLYMYLIGARKQDLVYAAVLDAILLLITVLVGFFRYSSKVKALSNALKRPLEEQAQLRKQQMMWRYFIIGCWKIKVLQEASQKAVLQSDNHR